jgi:phage-related protein
LGTQIQQIAGWAQAQLLPALATLEPPIIAVAGAVATNILPALAHLYAIGHQLAEAILTPLIGLFENILPPVLDFAGVLGGAIATGFQIVSPLAGGLVDVLGDLVNFFTQTEVGGDLVKATLIAMAIPVGILALGFISLAVEAIAGFIMSIPAMVGGFIAGAAGAWSMAAGVIALTWPILLIIGIIAGIILLITHWGQVMSFLGGVFGAIGAWIGNVFSAIGTTAHNALNGIASFFVNKWNEVLGFVKSIPGKILSALANLAGILLAPFKWFYDHNTYVKQAVDAIHAKLTELKNTVGSIFSAIGTFIHDKLTEWKNFFGNIFFLIGLTVREKLTEIKNFFGNIFFLIGLTVHDKIMSVATFLYGIWTTVSSWIGSKLAAIRDTFGNIFSSIGTKVHDAITGLWNWLLSFVGGWPSQALQWGQNLIQGLINGITNMFGNLKNTLGNIAGNIASFLGFHSPTKEGAGRELDVWGPNMVKGFSRGIDKAAPALHASLNALVQPMAGYPIRSSASSAPIVIAGSAGGGGGGRGEQTFIFEFDGVQFARANGRATDKLVRLKLGPNGRAS